mgnify:CR=1 FL=1
MPTRHPEFPNLVVFDHPLIQHKLTWLRDESVSHRPFRALLYQIAGLMVYEVTRSLPTAVRAWIGLMHFVGYEGKRYDDGARYDEAVRLALRARDGAIARNIFGSPFFVVDGEMFWGNDRLDDALDHCAEQPR